MRSILRSYRGLVATFVALLTGLALGLVLGMHEEPGTQSSLPRIESPVQVAAGGPPSCLGFSLGDPCITRRALGECRAAVAQCGDEPIQVIQTCPLQFRCGR
jgi:hypothetical protein